MNIFVSNSIVHSVFSRIPSFSDDVVNAGNHRELDPPNE
jgi:hypothetical protein